MILYKNSAALGLQIDDGIHWWFHHVVALRNRDGGGAENPAPKAETNQRITNQTIPETKE